MSCMNYVYAWLCMYILSAFVNVKTIGKIEDLVLLLYFFFWPQLMCFCRVSIFLRMAHGELQVPGLPV